MKVERGVLSNKKQLFMFAVHIISEGPAQLIEQELTRYCSNILLKVLENMHHMESLH